MSWLLDERARPIPVRAASADPVGGIEDVTELGELLPVAGRSPEGIPDGLLRGWLTAEPADDPEAAWRRLARRFDRCGLWPLLVTGGGDRPFLSGELLPPAPPADATEVLRRCWEGVAPVRADGTSLPHPPWPGLAETTGDPTAADVLLPRLAGLGWAQRLLLVPTSRPADAVGQLGWDGACNWSLSGADIAGVLRSWEDRFGAYVVAVGFAELDVVVTRPPVDDDQCLRLAAEHFCFCPDNLSPQTFPETAPLSLPEYARQLAGARAWHFWWD